MQVDPIKPTLKAPGTKRLKLKYDKMLSNIAFKFNLRRYTKGARAVRVEAAEACSECVQWLRGGGGGRGGGISGGRGSGMGTGMGVGYAYSQLGAGAGAGAKNASPEDEEAGEVELQEVSLSDGECEGANGDGINLGQGRGGGAAVGSIKGHMLSTPAGMNDAGGWTLGGRGGGGDGGRWAEAAVEESDGRGAGAGAAHSCWPNFRVFCGAAGRAYHIFIAHHVT